MYTRQEGTFFHRSSNQCKTIYAEIDGAAKNYFIWLSNNNLDGFNKVYLTDEYLDDFLSKGWEWRSIDE